MIHWEPFHYEGVAYDLTHLHPKTVEYEQPAIDGSKPPRRYTVDVIFGLHCFTRDFKKGEELASNLLYADSRERRIFDFERYELSKHLPQIVADLPPRKCYHTGKGNFFSVEILNQRDGTKIEYDIFFKASRSSRKGVINLFVQSAYSRDSRHGSNRPRKKPIGFYVILFNTLNNRPFRVQQ